MNNKVTPLTFAVGAALLATGCIPEQDAGSASYAFNGSVIDPYIQRAEVWADINNNGKLDDFELPYIVKTDNDGKFKDLVLPQNLFAGNTKVTLRSRGGYDQWTSQNAQGDMVMQVGAGNAASVVISPLSTLKSSGNSGVAAYLASLGFDPSVDYLDEFTTADATVANEALKLHKTLLMLAEDMAEDNDELTLAQALEQLYKQLAPHFELHDDMTLALNSLLDDLYPAAGSMSVMAFSATNQSHQPSDNAVALARAALKVLDDVLDSDTKLTESEAVVVEALTRRVQSSLKRINKDGENPADVLSQIEAIEGEKLKALAKTLDSEKPDNEEDAKPVDFDKLRDSLEDLPELDENGEYQNADGFLLGEETALPDFSQGAYSFELTLDAEEEGDASGVAAIYLAPSASDVSVGDLTLCVDYDDGKDTYLVVKEGEVKDLTEAEYLADDGANYDFSLEDAIFLDIGDWSKVSSNRLEIALEIPFLGRIASVITTKGWVYKDADGEFQSEFVDAEGAVQKISPENYADVPGLDLFADDVVYQYQLESDKYDELNDTWTADVSPLEWKLVEGKVPTSADTCEIFND